jgi:lipopolysaccharide exporter
MSIRRAYVAASIEQYLGLVINLCMVAILARLLTPGEVGLAVIGMSIAATVFALREFASPEFLIQRPDVTCTDIRTSQTASMLATLVLGLAIVAAAPGMAWLYDDPSLVTFLAVMVMGGLLESASLTTVALLRRSMAFGPLALIRTGSSVTTAAVTIWLAWRGHGHMSYAWGLLAGYAIGSCLALCAKPPASLWPSLRSWRELWTFGRYRGAATVVDKAYETLPQLVLGRLMPISAVAFYNRGNAICGIPDRVLLSAAFSIAFPALSAQARDGQDLKDSYLRALSYITVFYWPGLVCLAIVADPVVRLLLGDQWEAVVPLVRVLALSSLFWFPVTVSNPLLLAIGRNRDAFIATLLGRSVAAAILVSASFFGLFALAMSQFIALPFQMVVALRSARAHVPFGWRELIDLLWPSLVVTGTSAAGPLCIAVAIGGFNFSYVEMVFAGFLAGVGWLGGLSASRHPFLVEMDVAVRAAARFLPFGAWLAGYSERLLTTRHPNRAAPLRQS